ncbi:hypothetical protein IEQ34_022484 [Dendrobium chrysotoxum]|uniref:Uncharacterized protein n=1 Tax=Dendrobium chrysotoxum TaxID=161865 RepID=A0AAV7FZ48_DENCH|nr:hypothetical protein IEQ34_022484 [Dendrobium chrysotoxum]
MVVRRGGGRSLRISGIDKELQSLLEVKGRAEEGLPKCGGELVIEPRQYPMRADQVSSFN